MSALQIRYDLSMDELDEMLSETPGQTATDTFRVQFGDGAEGLPGDSTPNANALLMALSDESSGTALEDRCPDPVLGHVAVHDQSEPDPEPERLSWHRWFSPVVDGTDVGLDLFPFDPDSEFGLELDRLRIADSAEAEALELGRPPLAGPESDRTGSRRFRRMLIAIRSLAKLFSAISPRRREGRPAAAGNPAPHVD